MSVIKDKTYHYKDKKTPTWLRAIKVGERTGVRGLAYPWRVAPQQSPFPFKPIFINQLFALERVLADFDFLFLFCAFVNTLLLKQSYPLYKI